MSIEIVILGSQELIDGLNRFPDVFQRAIAGPARSGLMLVGGQLASYPSPPTGSTYARTGDLGRMWATTSPTFEGSGLDFSAALGNSVVYGPWVQDEKAQAKVHAGRWTTVMDAAQRVTATIQQLFEQALQSALNQVGGS